MKKNLPLLGTILTILGNYSIPKLNGQSIGQNPGNSVLEAQPVGFTFGIWGLIYLSLIYLSYKIYKKEIIWSNSSISLYLLSCSFNLLWINFWTKSIPDISQYLLIGIVLSLYLLWKQNIKISNKKIFQNILSSYLSWTLGASLLNIFIVRGEGINNFGSKIILYLISAIQILWQIINNKDQLEDSLLFPVTGLWTGIGIASNNSSSLGYLKYLPMIISLGASYNHYNKIGKPNLNKLFFE
tara:strand:- start:1151 stop:1873 length:723 start_codon:yes stop_codon:yes gene_type:complete